MAGLQATARYEPLHQCLVPGQSLKVVFNFTAIGAQILSRLDVECNEDGRLNFLSASEVQRTVSRLQENVKWDEDQIEEV